MKKPTNSKFESQNEETYNKEIQSLEAEIKEKKF
jgi:hypothetical protein